MAVTIDFPAVFDVSALRRKRAAMNCEFLYVPLELKERDWVLIQLFQKHSLYLDNMSRRDDSVCGALDRERLLCGQCKSGFSR